MKKINFILLAALFSTLPLFSQEALKSVEEEYYNFLSLSGITTRNYITYRTLTDSKWEIPDFSVTPWQNLNLGTTFELVSDKPKKEYIPAKEINTVKDFFYDTGIFFANGIEKSVEVKLYGPESFNSYNTAAPFGFYDGALWQGKGYNSSLTTGLYVKAFCFEATIKPQLSFSQNAEFEIMDSAYSSEYGYFWGYGTNSGVDCPQRFGDSSFWTYDWGDSEIRFSWYNLTVGFGTQSPWIGPAFQNPLLHSNNAATYPKLDFGIKKTSLYMPYFGWYLGDFEARIWYGYLSESKYFDDDDTNDHNMIGGFTISYAPPFLPGLTLGATKICLSKWGDNVLRYANPLWKLNTLSGGAEDQKASITADWLFPEVGLEVYGEIGIDDFLSKGFKFYEYARYPFHSMTYTVGLRKAMEISEKHSVYGELGFEWNCTEMSDDFYLWHTYNFGFHHQITQGYTNLGQWLGSGIGYGGNSQVITYKIYSPHGYEKFYIGRYNPDNNYIYSKAVGTTSTSELSIKYFTAFKANFFVGFEGMFCIHKAHELRYGFAYDLIINPLYNPGLSSNGYYREYTYWNNFYFTLGYKFQI